MSKGKKKKKRSKLGMLVLVGILTYFAYLMITQQTLIDGNKKDMLDIQNKIAAEKKLNSQLQKQKKDVHSSDYIEKTAREKLGLVKDGEKIFVDIDN